MRRRRSEDGNRSLGIPFLTAEISSLAQAGRDAGIHFSFAELVALAQAGWEEQQHQQRQAKVGGFAPGGCGPSDIDDSGSRVSSGSGSSSGSSSGPGVGGEAGQLHRARWGLLGSHGTCPRRPPAPRAGGRRPPAPSPQCPGRSRHSSAKQGAQRPCESRRQRVRAAPARVKSSRPDAYQVLD